MYKDIEETTSRISQIRELLRYTEHLVEPSIPELSFKPDFMINFENQLTFIEIFRKKRKESIDWSTLRLLEHIFEVKLFFGNQSVFALMILDRELWKPYCLELLENFFDKVIYEHTQDIGDFYAKPKVINFELWDLEREFNRSRYKKFSEVDLEPFEYRPTSFHELEYESYQRLISLGLEPIKHYGIKNLKSFYLKREMDLRFYFDFFLPGRERDKIIEIKSFKRINDFRVQNLLIKSRLIRYQKILGEIRQVPAFYRMILLINGNIRGPKYDRMRYLRMLTAAGWDVYPISILYDKKTANRVFRDE